MKAMLACNYEPLKLRFPVGVQPKIDGVRGLNMTGKLTGRSGKSFKNNYTTQFFSKEIYKGLDGELAAEYETYAQLCRLTSSATGTILQTPYLIWHVFDLLTEDTKGLCYSVRHKMLKDYLETLLLLKDSNSIDLRLKLVPMQIVDSLEDLNKAHDYYIQCGYEGTIIRDLFGLHKEGRSSVKQMGLLRIKDFIEEEFLITGITEGNKNNNVAQTNELGKTFRSSHQENKEPNGMLGSLQGVILKDSDLFKKGNLITVAPGVLTENECLYYFNNSDKLIGKIGKFKHFPKGVKDKPRFPQFQSIRTEEDM